MVETVRVTDLQSTAGRRSTCIAAGVPLKPMLAGITEGVPDALKQLGVEDGLPFLAEYKYDGIRAQVGLC